MLKSAKEHEITLTIGQLSSRATLPSTLIRLAVICTRNKRSHIEGCHLRRTEHRTLPCRFPNIALHGAENHYFPIKFGPFMRNLFQFWLLQSVKSFLEFHNVDFSIEEHLKIRRVCDSLTDICRIKANR